MTPLRQQLDYRPAMVQIALYVAYARTSRQGNAQ